MMTSETVREIVIGILMRQLCVPQIYLDKNPELNDFDFDELDFVEVVGAVDQAADFKLDDSLIPWIGATVNEFCASIQAQIDAQAAKTATKAAETATKAAIPVFNPKPPAYFPENPWKDRAA